MAKRPPRRKNTDIDIFDDVDLDVAQSMLSDATGRAVKESGSRVMVPEPAAAARKQQKNPLSEAPAVQAVAEADASVAEELSPDPVAVEPTNVLLKFRVRQATRARFDSFKAELSVALGGTRLTDANIGRALLDWILLEVSDQVIEAAKSEPGLRRPASDDAVAMAKFDQTLKEVLKRGIYEGVGR